MSGFVAFHYKSYGTFGLHEKKAYISRVVLPTTEMIEPKKASLLTKTCFSGC
ncbi:hypothetical protein [Streptococcus halichoeri]|uniref:hypothetical protein n=1 Tax=Streptococcus halichoeri TaxID=254785 RepID=UPI00191746A0|nr:hypothetical protein [Streptococcus halichoeri]